MDLKPKRFKSTVALLAASLGAVAVVVTSSADVPPVASAPPGTVDSAEPRTRPVRKPGADGEIVITPDEWKSLETFMLTHSPNKWQMYSNLPDKPLKQTLRKQITQRYRNLQRIERNDPVRWKLEIEAIGLEDKIYLTLQSMRSANDMAELEQQLRNDVDQLVANRDQWKKERLLRVKAELESMKVPGALKPVEEELQRLDAATPQYRAPRVDKRIEDFKKQVDKPPRALLGGQSPASGVPIDLGGPVSK